MGLVISDSLIFANYLMKLFCCCEKVFTHMTTQKLSADGFWLVENTSQLNKAFIKNYNEDTDERYFLGVNV